MLDLALPMSTVRQCIDSRIAKHLQMLTYLAAWYFQAWFQQSANLQMTFTKYKSTLEYPQFLHRKKLRKLRQTYFPRDVRATFVKPMLHFQHFLVLYLPPTFFIRL